MTKAKGVEFSKWFFVGFSLIFVGILMVKTQLSWLPSGEGLMRVKLWQYYIIEIRRTITSTGEFGPTSGSGYTALIVFAQHLVVAGVSGFLVFGVKLLICRVRN